MFYYFSCICLITFHKCLHRIVDHLLGFFHHLQQQMFLFSFGIHVAHTQVQFHNICHMVSDPFNIRYHFQRCGYQTHISGHRLLSGQQAQTHSFYTSLHIHHGMICIQQRLQNVFFVLTNSIHHTVITDLRMLSHLRYFIFQSLKILFK